MKITPALLASGVRGVVLDTMAVTGLARDARAAGFELLSVLRAGGISVVNAAVNSAAVRMIGSAVAFGTGMPIKFFSTFDEAFADARERTRKT